MNLGTHPTAYIRLPKEHPLFDKDYAEANELADDIEPVHGWWTFSGNIPSTKLDEPIKEGYYLGFDAGHIQDYQPNILADLYPGSDFGTDSGHRWTTEEMVDECKNGIDWLIEVADESGKRH